MRILFWVTNIAFWAFFMITSFILFFGAVLIRLVTWPFDPNRKVLQKYSCFWSSLYVWCNPFWSVKVTGHEHLERGKSYVMVSNHKSFMDILIIFRSFLHFKWVSKASMFKAPLLGWNMKLNGYIPITRGDPISREKCMNDCMEWLKKGSSVFFFPEGTRSKDGKLQRFKPGAFRLAVESGHDILPMVIQGSEHAVPKHSILLTKKSKMSLDILPPISVKGFDPKKLEAEATRLADLVFEKIQKYLEQYPLPKPSAA